MASPLTTAEQVRLRINDPYRYEQELIYGDATASSFKLKQGAPYSHISAGATASIYVENAQVTGWSATGHTFDGDAGRIMFSGTPSADTGIMVDYFWSVFTENDVGHFTAVGGGVAGAALEAVNVLLFNSHKRARWAAPDGSDFDDSKATQNLIQIRSALVAEIKTDIGPEGGVESWAEEQENYS